MTDYRCFFCFARGFEKLIEKENLTVDDKNSFTREMTNLYNKVGTDFLTPEFSRSLHKILKGYTNNSDPYKEEKRNSNDLVLGMYKDLKERILQSDNPFDTALRLAIAGNIIDFAVSSNFNLQSTVENVLHSDFAIDHSKYLEQAIYKADTVLYLGDNCGEIVFDKLFIETINHSNVIYAVRGAPVSNDVTLDDALYVKMDTVARVISNGHDAPSTLVNSCSTEFKDMFNKADVIISKGQGNLEGLLNETGKDIYFLLMIKCDVIAECLGVKKGEFVVYKNNKTR
jgi:uncharacterized protein with ATP-grasp and redox domains